MLIRSKRAAMSLLALHVATILALTVLFLYLSTLSGPEDGANIGAGMVVLPILVLGLPWSLLVFVERFVVLYYVPNGPLPPWAVLVDQVAVFAPAYVNIFIHAVVSSRRWRTVDSLEASDQQDLPGPD